VICLPATLVVWPHCLLSETSPCAAAKGGRLAAKVGWLGFRFPCTCVLDHCTCVLDKQYAAQNWAAAGSPVFGGHFTAAAQFCVPGQRGHSWRRGAPSDYFIGHVRTACGASARWRELVACDVVCSLLGGVCCAVAFLGPHAPADNVRAGASFHSQLCLMYTYTYM
jgi:hypothetical protein